MNMRYKVMPAIAVAVAIAMACWSLVAGRYNNRLSLAAIGVAAENSRIIAELQRSVGKLERSVDKALEQAHFLESALMPIPVVVTAYNPLESQTDSTPHLTASNKLVRPGIVALSRDLEEEFGFTFGDTVVIQGIGSFVFEDRMHKRWRRRVDILMFSREDARKFGHQHSNLMISFAWNFR
jgi:3D (Asp-Asp-Asp) domain-containing protein